MRPDQAPTFGVVIPCYRVARYAPAAVASVCAQTRPDWVLVVVDDGSPDDLAGALAPQLGIDSRVRFVRTENQGVCAARNRGLAELPSEVTYVCFLDGDDALLPDALKQLGAELAAHPGAALAHGEPLLVDADGRPLVAQRWMPRWAKAGRLWARVLSPAERDETPFEAVYAEAGLVPSLTLYRRACLPAAPFDPELGQPGEDHDLNQLLALRHSVRHLPGPVARYRVHPAQCTRDQGRVVRQRRRMREKWQRRADLSAEERARLASAEAFLRGPLALRLALIEGKRALRCGEWGAVWRATQALGRSLRGKGGA